MLHRWRKRKVRNEEGKQNKTKRLYKKKKEKKRKGCIVKLLFFSKKEELVNRLNVNEKSSKRRILIFFIW